VTGAALVRQHPAEHLARQVLHPRRSGHRRRGRARRPGSRRHDRSERNRGLGVVGGGRGRSGGRPPGHHRRERWFPARRGARRGSRSAAERACAGQGDRGQRWGEGVVGARRRVRVGRCGARSPGGTARRGRRRGAQVGPGRRRRGTVRSCAAGAGQRTVARGVPVAGGGAGAGGGARVGRRGLGVARERARRPRRPGGLARSGGRDDGAADAERRREDRHGEQSGDRRAAGGPARPPAPPAVRPPSVQGARRHTCPAFSPTRLSRADLSGRSRRVRVRYVRSQAFRVSSRADRARWMPWVHRGPYRGTDGASPRRPPRPSG
jgi:hypothetical protein